MAFKKITDYNEEKYGGLFVLKDDKEYADVILLYRSINDVLIADTHYIKSPEYSGYVHCTDKASPALAKGIRVQTKLFIPLYNLSTKRIEFWDRNVRFENVLNSQVFSKVVDPINYVFRITRNGAAGDVNTTYQFELVGKNNMVTYNAILEQEGVTMPEHYETICRTVTNEEMAEMLESRDNENGYSPSSAPEYVPVARGSVDYTPEYNPTQTSVELPSMQDNFDNEIEDIPNELPSLNDEDVSF